MITHPIKPCALVLLALLTPACQNHIPSTHSEAREKWQRDRTWDQLFQTEEHELRKQRREENRH